MVTVGRVVEAFGIPQSTVYYLVRIGKIPAHDVTQSWHKQRRLQFKLSEVRAALDAMKDQHPDAPPR